MDFLRRKLTVDRQLIVLPGRDPEYGPPKTQASCREVPLPSVVLEASCEHVRLFPGEPSEPIFRNDRGQPPRRTGFTAGVWTPAVRVVGSPIRFHDLRHYYASLLIAHGESVKVVQARLGHATAAETLDTYGHLWPDSEDSTRAAVDAVLGGVAANLRPTAEA